MTGLILTEADSLIMHSMVVTPYDITIDLKSKNSAVVDAWRAACCIHKLKNTLHFLEDSLVSSLGSAQVSSARIIGPAGAAM
jgi:hypothetical protein